jgi:hypothetical protein
MPHQCLKCGKVFEEGSSQLLRGCPDCGGNRFFFTKQPLDEKERNAISLKVEQDITTKIIDLIGKEKKEIIEKSGKWPKVEPKKIQEIIEQQKTIEEKESKPKIEKVPEILDDEYRKTIIEKLKAEQELESPETIDIEKPGKYRIDLKGLLEEEPIIIQKDGSYTIHLPSVFKMIDKEK